MMPRRATRLVKKKNNNKNRRKQNLEDGANNMQSHIEDNQRRSLSIKYLIVTLALKYPDYFICFYCVQSGYFKVPFDYFGRMPE